MRYIAAALVLIACIATPAYAAAPTPKMVAFTFDDGPRPEFLSKALPLFARAHIRVTFFVIGANAKRNPDWIRREFAEGHEIENHTMHHACLAKPNPKWTACRSVSTKDAIREVQRAMDVIEALTGYRTRFVRPPHFAITRDRKRELESALGIRVLTHGSASIGSLDWVYRNAEQVANQVMHTVISRGDGPCVVVFHENDVTLQALPVIIKFFRDRGYEFVRLDEFVKRAPHAEI